MTPATGWSAPGSGAAQPVTPPVGVAATTAVPGAGASPPGTARPAGPPTALPGSPVERLRPRRIPALADAGFDVLRFRFRTVMVVSAVVLLPTAAVPGFISNRASADAFAEAGRVLDNAGNGNLNVAPFGLTSGGHLNPAVQILLILLPALGMALLGVGLGHLVEGWLIGEDRTSGAALGVVARRLPVVLVTFTAGLVLRGLGTLCCYVGMVVVIGAFLPLSPIIAMERLGPFASMGRCWQLSKRSLGRGILLVMMMGIVSSVLGQTIALVQFGVVVELLHGAWWAWGVSAALGFAVTMLVAPLQASVAVLHYLDLRARSEGLDLELEARAAFVVPA